MSASHTPTPPRWRYRFDNYSSALALLREGIRQAETSKLSQLEKEGLVQRFEYTWELAWKLLKDYLEAEGVVLATITPKTVIRAAFSAKLISDGDTWMAALDARNAMSHTYDLKTFEKAIIDIRDHYLQLFEALHASLGLQAQRNAPGA